MGSTQSTWELAGCREAQEDHQGWLCADHAWRPLPWQACGLPQAAVFGPAARDRPVPAERCAPEASEPGVLHLHLRVGRREGCGRQQDDDAFFARTKKPKSKKDGEEF